MERRPVDGTQEFHAPVITFQPTDRLAVRAWINNTDGICTLYEGENGVHYFHYEDGKVAIADDQYGKNKRFVNTGTSEGQKTMEAIWGLKARDEAIHAVRREKAKEVARGDAMLERILRVTIEHEDGIIPDPYIIDGVELFRVGGNLSHTALLGVKEGRVYLFSDGPELYVLPDIITDDMDLNRLVDDVIDHLVCECVSMQDAYGELFNIDDADERLRQQDVLFDEFKRKHGDKIRAAIVPKLAEYVATKKLDYNSNFIEVPLDEEVVVHLYLKRILEDVTDKDEVYIGRGNYFHIKEKNEKSKSQKN